MTDLSVFSSTYPEARWKFLDAARAAGAQVAHYLHPGQKGPEGEALYLDVAVLGRPDAPNRMVVGYPRHRGLVRVCRADCLDQGRGRETDRT